jgi:arylsulfatase
MVMSGLGMALAKKKGKIIHDAEHYILLQQHGQTWATEDKQIDARLAELRRKNGGKPPNFVYILLDDLGFGEIGMPNLDVIRGYSTPRISKLADEGLSLMRMYTEPSCTPTRVAMSPQQGRLCHRSYGKMAPGRHRGILCRQPGL